MAEDKLVPAAPAALEPVFEPTMSQVAFVVRLKEALLSRAPVVEKHLLAAAGIKKRTTLSNWKRQAGFIEWLNAQLLGDADEEWAQVVLRHTGLAKAGSVRSAEFLLKVRTLAHRKTAAPAGVAGVSVTTPDGTSIKVVTSLPEPDWSQDAPEQDVPEQFVNEAEIIAERIPELVTGITDGKEDK